MTKQKKKEQKLKIVTLRLNENDSEIIIELMDRYYTSAASKAILKACGEIRGLTEEIKGLRQEREDSTEVLEAYREDLASLVQAENLKQSILKRRKDITG